MAQKLKSIFSILIGDKRKDIPGSVSAIADALRVLNQFAQQAKVDATCSLQDLVAVDVLENYVNSTLDKIANSTNQSVDTVYEIFITKIMKEE